MLIDLGSENQVLNGSSTLTRPMSMVRIIPLLARHSILIRDARRRNDREMGRPVLQEMFRKHIKWQLEGSRPVLS